MTKKSKTEGGRQQSQECMQHTSSVLIGVPNSTDAKKTRNINVLQGIMSLDLHKSLTSNATQETPEKTLLGNDKEHNSSGKQSWTDMEVNELECEEILG